jgi:DNA-directed RNA polymerase subunit F
MIAEKIISKKPVTLADVKELMKDRSKEKELVYEQDMTLKYVDKFAKLSAAKAKKLVEELLEIKGVDEEFAAKIADILPENKDTVLFIAPKRAKLEDSETEKIVSTVKRYL